MRAANARSVNRMLVHMTDSEAIPKRLLDALVSSIGGEGDLPSTKERAEKIAEATGRPVAMDLYRNLFIPLSAFCAHGTGLALLRHVSPRNKLSDDPMFPWTVRASVRATDACMGVLAASIAEKNGAASQEFAIYADAHLARTLLPVMAVFGRSAWRSIHWQLVPRAIAAQRALRSYYQSGAAAADSQEVRETRTRSSVEQLFGVFDSAGSDSFARAVDAVTLELTTRLGNAPPSVASDL
jgi:hypothetical protein